MDNVITITGVWMVSLVSGIVSIAQPKGNDWYKPISNKEKMIMTLVNSAVLSAVLMLHVEYIFHNINIFAYMGMTLLFVFFGVFLRKLIKVGVNDGLKKALKTVLKKDDTNNGRKLKDLFQRFLTVFNSSFFILTSATIIYFIYKEAYVEHKEILEVTVNDVLSKNKFLISMITFHFYSLVVATIYTAVDWVYGDKIEEKYKKVIKKDGEFLMSRIKSRGK